MASLRRLLGRLAGNRAGVRGNATPASGVDLGEHGDHWGCVLRPEGEPDLLEALHRLGRRGSLGVELAAEGGVRLVTSDGEPLGICALVEGKRVVSAYPEVRGGQERSRGWPVTVHEVLPLDNGLEARISGECHGAAVGFFDTRYLANRHRYEAGKSYRFQMGALAYTLEPAAEAEAERVDMDGVKVSLRGACAYMPAVQGNDLAEPDDYWFHSPLDAEPRMAALLGRYLQGYSIVLAIPDDFEMSLTLYAADHVTSPAVRTLTVGEDLEGFLWLQGYLSAEDEG